MPFILDNKVIYPNSVSHYNSLKSRNIPWMSARKRYPTGTYYIRDPEKEFFEGYYAEDIGIFITESESSWIARVTNKTIKSFSYSQLEKLLEYKKVIEDVVKEIDDIVKEVDEGEKHEICDNQ